jgi:hypothetical protein
VQYGVCLALLAESRHGLAILARCTGRQTPDRSVGAHAIQDIRGGARRRSGKRRKQLVGPRSTNRVAN